MQNGPSQGPREDIHPLSTVALQHTPLHEAAAIGDYKSLEIILTAGADRNAKDAKHGNTPLHEAAWRGYSKCVKALCILPKISREIKESKSKHLKGVIQATHGSLHSALLGTRNSGGFSALHLAAQNGHNQSCREILLAGGDPDVQNNYGDTPLHTACRYGHAGATRILLSAKCDPFRVNLNGDTPLHIACAMGRRKLTRILLFAANSLQIKNAQGETARDIALRKKLPEIVEILDTPVEDVQPDRDRSSSSSRHKKKIKEKETKDVKKVKAAENPKNWSPYGCHYFPDPRSFPSPKLETLPKEPLGSGEQYYLDLAGNIRKGPVGVGNTCYCGPFFRHIEDRISRNKKSLKKYVHKATEKLGSKVDALALKTDDQIEQITRTMLTDRLHCDERRLHLEQWLKRGDRTRVTVAPHTSKSRKDETNTNTLTRSRSLEILDDNVYSSKIDSFTPVLTRSYDMLDTHDVIVHHSADNDSGTRSGTRSGGRSVHNTTISHSDKKNSIMDDDSIEQEYSDKDKCSSLSEKGKCSSTERDRHFVEDKSSSDVSKRKQTRESKNRYSVAERLEELLSKTNEIIEMERKARKKSKAAFSLISPERVRHRSKGTDKLKVSASSKSSGYEVDLIQQFRTGSSIHDSGDYHSGHNDSSFIAHEMEKITSSLLGYEQEADIETEKIQPVSPEIAKEYRSPKEQKSTDGEDHEKTSILSRGSHRSAFVPSGKTDKCVNQPSYYVDENYRFDRNTKQTVQGTNRDDKEQNKYTFVDVNVPGTANTIPDDMLSTDFAENSELNQEHPAFSGFYQNTCFDDVSSSSNTIKSERQQASSKIKNFNQLSEGGTLDVDDRCELSEMANMRELNELKSRILNGSHWRSQVLRKSAQDVNQSTREARNSYETSEEILRDEQIKDGNKLDVSESIDTSQQQDGHTEIVDETIMPARIKVNELVAKIQGFKNFHTSGTQNFVTDNGVNKYNEDNSESSEDEDEIDFSQNNQTIDTSNTKQKPELHQRSTIPEFSNSGLYVNQNYSTYSQIHQIQPTTFAECTISEPQTINYNTHVNQPYNMQVPRIIDTRCLIPKDAYFHELPNKNKLKPITDNLAEQQVHQRVAMPTVSHTITARSRNPLLLPPNDANILHNIRPHTLVVPTYVMSNNQFLPYHRPAEPQRIYHPQPIDYNHNCPMKPLPHPEKLLSSRKFGTTNPDIDIKRIHQRIDSSTSSLPLEVANAPNYVIDQTPIERDLSNDSGYSTKIGGSSLGPSPSLSGQTDCELIGQRSNISGNYDRYFVSNIGASSLV